MSAPIIYTLCSRRLGNRNKGVPGSTFSNLTVDATSGVIVGLGTLAQLQAQDTTYRVTQLSVGAKPPMRTGVNTLPVAIARFTLSSAANFDGDDKYRLARLIQQLNAQGRVFEENMDSPVFTVMDPIAVLQVVGITAIGTYTSTGWPTAAQDNFQILNTYYYPGDVRGSQGFRRRKVEYFVTNRTFATGPNLTL